MASFEFVAILTSFVLICCFLLQTAAEWRTGLHKFQRRVAV